MKMFEKLKALYDRYGTKDIQTISAVLSVLSTIVMTYLTVIMSIANERMAEANVRMAESNDRMSISGDQSFVLARYQHTLALCQRFNEMYGETQNIHRYEYKIWEENDIDYQINAKRGSMYRNSRQIRDRWTVPDSAELDHLAHERIHYLMNNEFFQQLLQFFEEAKILHKKQLLDVDAFENDFVGVLYRLQNTKHPTIDEFIHHVRSLSKRINNDKIWDGYYYCIQHVITQNYALPQPGTINKIYVSYGDTVYVGSVLLSYKPSGSDDEEYIVSAHNGEIVDCYIHEGMACDEKKVLLRISQRNYGSIP